MILTYHGTKLIPAIHLKDMIMEEESHPAAAARKEPIPVHFST